jgi:Cu(I)/Ag(I) efflux system periplasmic protein CusF
MSRFNIAALIALGLTVAGAAPALAGMNGWEWMNQAERLRAARSAADTPWVTAKITKTDKARGTLTIAHGAVPGIGMPAMLMTYAAADPGVLATLSKGDRVSVRLSTRGGASRVVDVAR